MSLRTTYSRTIGDHWWGNAVLDNFIRFWTVKLNSIGTSRNCCFVRNDCDKPIDTRNIELEHIADYLFSAQPTPRYFHWSLSDVSVSVFISNNDVPIVARTRTILYSFLFYSSVPRVVHNRYGRVMDGYSWRHLISRPRVWNCFSSSFYCRPGNLIKTQKHRGHYGSKKAIKKTLTKSRRVWLVFRAKNRRRAKTDLYDDNNANDTGRQITLHNVFIVMYVTGTN